MHRGFERDTGSRSLARFGSGCLRYWSEIMHSISLVKGGETMIETGRSVPSTQGVMGTGKPARGDKMNNARDVGGLFVNRALES